MSEQQVGQHIMPEGSTVETSEWDHLSVCHYLSDREYFHEDDDPDIVWVWTKSGPLDANLILTPDDAREVGRLLIKHADAVKNTRKRQFEEAMAAKAAREQGEE